MSFKKIVKTDVGSDFNFPGFLKFNDGTDYLVFVELEKVTKTDIVGDTVNVSFKDGSTMNFNHELRAEVAPVKKTKKGK